jgi:hypothetical protein
MAASLEETLTSVWGQALVEESKSVMLDNLSFPVRRTSRARLREVDFQFEGHELGEMANVAVFMASDKASGMTGTTVNFDLPRSLPSR